MALTIEYIAGFFDGEGNINMPLGGKCKPRVCFYQSGDLGREILMEIADFLKHWLGIETHLYHPSLKSGHQPMHQLKIYGRDNVESLLLVIRPYLRVKRTEAQDFIRYFKVFPPLAAVKYRTGKRRKVNP